MVLVWDILLFVLGIGLLVKGADWLVDGSARIAKQFGVSSFVIGITIVALGTSLPELGAAAIASLKMDSGLVLGDIIGSNIVNLSVVLGLAGLFVPIAVKRDIYRRDGMLMLFSTVLFYIFCFDGIFEAWEGGIFLFIFLAYITYFLSAKRRYRKELHFRRYLSDYAALKKKEKFDGIPNITKDAKAALHEHILRKIYGILHNFSRLVKRCRASVRRNWRLAVKKKAAILFFLKQLAIVFIGAACIFFGAEFTVSSAMRFPVDQIVVGLVFVSIGTSLPELSVTISSLRKGLPEIMIGNLIGSNIANILWIGGISSLINAIRVPASVITIDFVFLLWVTWMFLVFLRNDRKIAKIESITLFILYVLLLATNVGIRLGFGGT